MCTSTRIPDPRARLLALRADYAARLERLERDGAHRDAPLPAGFAEQAVATENDETLTALADAARAILGQIDHALQRLDAGLWGLCEQCGERIAEARLRHLPEATRCQHCAGKA
ncbi:TraR/DksA family transcriptional regulator [Solimonas soli]|uniref:TraR/DksA family transcriptional regulator n=1 Tax=Solimonas soli TaxID=413479 RepID=UPI0004BCB6E1|nr:TraR/DksA C4-type zinc finger protein [Solimonas soli]